MSHSRTGEKRDWQGLHALLATSSHIVFSTHVQPDADGLGSELALARFLKSQGKTVHILNPSALRVSLEFLPEAGEVDIYDSDKHMALLETADLFIAFDVGHYHRLKQLGEDLLTLDTPKISIDHHPGDKSQFDQTFDHPSASSTGVLIHDLLTSMDRSAVSRPSIALPLYAAMMSDTGNFRFNNTDPETLMAAAELVAAGVKPYELYVHLYEDLNTPGRLHVLQYLMQGMKYACEGRLAWSVIDFEALRSLGAEPDDLHSLSDFIRSIKGVEIGVAITRQAGEKVDVSFRSKGKIPINQVAQSFGGGGHAFAAGCHVEGELESAAEVVIKACVTAIEEWDKHA